MQPTTTLTICRGADTNSHGDKTNVGIPLYRGVPAALVEKSYTTYDPSAQARRTIRQWMAVLQPWTDLLANDTVQDEMTGSWFMVISLQSQPTLGVPPDLIAMLRERSGVSVRSDG